MNNYLFIFFSLLVLKSCSNKSNFVEIRVYNGTSSTMQKVLLREVAIGEVKDKKFSKYNTFDYGYPYDKVSCVIKGKKYEVIPIDFTGVKRLEPGKYTYRLTLNNEMLYLQLNRD